MSDNQKWSNIGEEIRDAVEDALKSRDFSRINDVISDTVTGALNNVKEQFVGKGAGREETAAENRYVQPEKTEELRVRLAPFNRIGSVSGTLCQVFGGIGTGVMSVLSVVFLGLALGFGRRFMGNLILFLILLAASVIAVNVGCGQKHRLKRAEKYREIAGNRHYINVEDIALHTGKSAKFIRKDIKRMLKAGFFPEGHLDRQESCLMLNDKVYGEYLRVEKQRMLYEKERRAEKEKQNRHPAPVSDKAVGLFSSDHPELDAMITEGKGYIRRLRELNDNIPGEVISRKLYRLEKLLEEIFDTLKTHPEQMPQMQKFMNYYLPTTIKLVGAYEEFDSMSMQGEDIEEARAEIEKTLDTINGAFRELLNKFFRETAYDVTADAQVLQTMLAKEGLTGGINGNE